MSDKQGVYSLGPGSRAWQFCIGCSPNQRCAPECWARKTVARVAQTMHRQREQFFSSVLTPDFQHWNGCVRIDEAHLTDPLRWKKPALIAGGFHGDLALLPPEDLDRVFAVAIPCQQHEFCFLTKHPELLVDWMKDLPAWPREVRFGSKVSDWLTPHCSDIEKIAGKMLEPLIGHRCDECVPPDWPLPNVSLGVSLMDQQDADRHLPAMRALHELGWRVHIWNEPALGPINWTGYEFAEVIIQGGQSGPKAKPMHPDWARNTRDWCAKNGISYFFKQWGEWLPVATPRMKITIDSNGRTLILHADGTAKPGTWDDVMGTTGDVWAVQRVGKKVAGYLLDLQEHRELPDSWRAEGRG